MSRGGYDLRIGDLSLIANDEGSYAFDVQGANVTLGNPAPVSDVISSLLRDGELTTTNHFGNREASFLVEIKAPNAGVLADGEAALMVELDKVNTLTWQVPYGADTLFDVVRSWPEFMFDDLTEVRRMTRVYRVVVECLAFARSADTVTINWTGPGTETSLATTAGWTVVSGGSIEVASGHIQNTATATATTLSRSVLLDDYLWLKVDGEFGGSLRVVSVTVDGTSVPAAEIRNEAYADAHFVTIPTSTWRGTTATVQFTIVPYTAGLNRAILYEFWTVSYPNLTAASSDVAPRGIGVVDTIGSARAACTIAFTAPAGGAFVYTAPDPNETLHAGAAENVFSHFVVTAPDGAEVGIGSVLMWFPPGTHSAQIGFTDARPTELYPNGMWPQEVTDADQFVYPADPRASVSYMDTSGAKTIVSPSPSLPQGYDSGAIVHEVHSVHPGRMGFGVVDQNGAPVAATITYYPHWWAHAAR